MAFSCDVRGGDDLPLVKATGASPCPKSPSQVLLLNALQKKKSSVISPRAGGSGLSPRIGCSFGGGMPSSLHHVACVEEEEEDDDDEEETCATRKHGTYVRAFVRLSIFRNG